MTGRWKEEKILGPESEIIAVVSWLLAILFLQISIWPYLKEAFQKFSYPVSLAGGVLLFMIFSWYCGIAGAPVYLALLPFGALCAWAVATGRYSWREYREQWPWITVFLVFFLFMLEVRFVNPSISYAEKFMDHAFMASIIRTPVVPPLDPWFLGGTLDVYYYLGYWIFGTLALITGVPSNIAFNLALPTVLGLSAVMMFALAHLLTKRFHWLPLLTFLVVNPSFVYQVLQGKSLGSVLWDSTRTIPNTINEYPIFSFLWGDVHPHVIGIFNQVFLIFLLVYAWERWTSASSREKWIIAGLCAVSLGAMPLINTWDVLVYAPVTVLFGIILWYRGTCSAMGRDGNCSIAAWIRQVITSCRLFLSGTFQTPIQGPTSLPGRFISLPWAFLVLVPLISVLFYLPFYFQMNTAGIQGVGIVHTPTSPPDFLLVHGIFLFIFIIYLAKDIRKRPYLLLISVPFALAGYTAAAIAVIPLVYLIARRKMSPAELLAVLGLIIIILCEFFYLKDNMGETYYRMNTLFKFYIGAWLLMGASSFSMLAQMIGRKLPEGWISRKKSAIITVIAVLFLLSVPILVPLDSPYRSTTLDGLAYLTTAHPGDAEAVAYLRALPGTVGIVEAEGGDYTYFSRISSFTGHQAVIGMPFHEFMWRTDKTGWYGERLNDIRAMYEDPQQTRALMEKYNASLIYVGDSERERYTVRVSESGLPLLYDRAGVQIYLRE